MATAKLRVAQVAGQFYPASAGSLKKQIESFIDLKAAKKDAIACMLPHAGYVYSGLVAGQTVCRVKVKETAVLFGPNHTGMGHAYSIMTSGTWQTPLGNLEIDREIARGLLKECAFLKEDETAHLNEHSLEVELPFLQYFNKDLKIVPIAFMSDDLEILKKIGRDIAHSIEERSAQGSILIVASSDMTHYEPQEQAAKKDARAIEAILELDEDRLFERIAELRISMCGYAPVIAMISAAKKLGATKAELIKYQTSGDTTGDHASVVGYAGIIIS
ncbi:MAG: AmmeMemoRadiSam system protein B [Candidatus Omnitrophica bacterium]|nr:AmmeMemoRadiSam system protein B [Candidatus Omnitrophota bacterium]MDD5512388.1 AmmeMemoRadiSam system protein B [Candidatus Omnitrophota bacterium]